MCCATFVCRAKETSLFEKLMDQHSIPHEPMEDVVTLDAGYFIYLQADTLV